MELFSVKGRHPFNRLGEYAHKYMIQAIYLYMCVCVSHLHVIVLVDQRSNVKLKDHHDGGRAKCTCRRTKTRPPVYKKLFVTQKGQHLTFL